MVTSVRLQCTHTEIELYIPQYPYMSEEFSQIFFFPCETEVLQYQLLKTAQKTP